MKAITPFELQLLIDKGNVELIDVRPRQEFKTVHALVARSVPSEFEPHSVLAHRKLDRRAPLYIMCRNRMLASLAACDLAGLGGPRQLWSMAGSKHGNGNACRLCASDPGTCR